MPDLWTNAFDLRIGLRCMQAVVRDSPSMAAEYHRILNLLRQSRRERRRFLTTLRADLLFSLLRRFARSAP